jgi:TPP-dependent pyruvate/acetoin dehydrogenase alpha subunit
MNPTISEKIHLTKEHCTKLLRMMMLIRRFEERCAEL